MQAINNFLMNLVTKVQELRDESGQTLVEYGLIVALISIVAIVALTLVGDEVSAVFDYVGNELGSATP